MLPTLDQLDSTCVQSQFARYSPSNGQWLSVVLARFSPDHLANRMDVDGGTPSGSINSTKRPNTDLT